MRRHKILNGVVAGVPEFILLLVFHACSFDLLVVFELCTYKKDLPAIIT